MINNSDLGNREVETAGWVVTLSILIVIAAGGLFLFSKNKGSRAVPGVLEEQAKSQLLSAGSFSRQ